MYFVCECGDKFRDLKSDANEHVRTKHKSFVEIEFNLALCQPTSVKTAELYELAVESVTDDMMDALYDDE